jgi:hypothetical protein
MTEPRNVQRCRWAEPTLFQDSPIWTEAEAYPWSCKADGDPRIVEDTMVCSSCGRWAPRGPERVARARSASERCHCECDGGCSGR